MKNIFIYLLKKVVFLDQVPFILTYVILSQFVCVWLTAWHVLLIQICITK